MPVPLDCLKVTAQVLPNLSSLHHMTILFSFSKSLPFQNRPKGVVL